VATKRFILGWQIERQGLASRFADRAQQLIASPQAMGNYMTYRDAIAILGLDPGQIYRAGRIDLPLDEWSDLGWMCSHIGPPKSAVEATRKAATAENIGPYSPDLIGPLRDLAAVKKFGRERDDEFEVIGTEGAQAGVAFTIQTLVNPGDEVIITDPGYFHFTPAVILAGGVCKAITLGPHNGYRLDPDELARAISKRTKLIVVCDPINPFGTIQTKDELIAIAEIAARAGAFVLDDITHDSHRIDPSAQHHPMTALYCDTDTSHVVATFGMSHGYGMAAARIGFLAGHPAIMRAALAAKIGLVRLNTNLIAQIATQAALEDEGYIPMSEEIILRNFRHLEETVAMTRGLRFPVKPQYGFSAVVDVSGTGVTSQELTISLFKRNVAVYPGDGLGDNGATEYMRLNFSQPDLRAFERLREALPEAIAEARSGLYRDKIIAFFERSATERGRAIIERLRKRPAAA
jgi:aspartate/methionine/tyrosine aminotransferase